jgi:hypothetical protein
MPPPQRDDEITGSHVVVPRPEDVPMRLVMLESAHRQVVRSMEEERHRRAREDKIAHQDQVQTRRWLIGLVVTVGLSAVLFLIMAGVYKERIDSTQQTVQELRQWHLQGGPRPAAVSEGVSE